MNATDGKRTLVLIRHSPYGSSLARASVDVALATAAFEQPVNLLFVGDGVLQLLSGQDCEALGVKNLGRLLSSLPLYDIDHVYVDAEAAARYQLDLDAAPVAALPLDPGAMAELVSTHDHLLGF
ncbi:MAG: sulfurtransferase complex subunit TusC [Halioglobus sp.]|nr:sulfurtransferase complex subunit TusC [Halioglobus sp.]MCB1708103.1 sulfurtransferase complex subunit TusC [Halioglobus sp.]MCP5122215.1 sulfurtransferase complex subunit TusC [Pseudomonadales bacterium]MCP5192240.1 sulfurtransferase complex subunit TusC [Pseudomonadales bacterium]